jgi:hypothetical protein
MMVADRGSTLSFLDLPVDVHAEIAQTIDPRIGSNPSIYHVSDPDNPSSAYRTSQPDLTLSRLTVCRRLYRIYAPFSTWRNLCIESKSSREASPTRSLSRYLDCPEKGIHARPNSEGPRIMRLNAGIWSISTGSLPILLGSKRSAASAGLAAACLLNSSNRSLRSRLFNISTWTISRWTTRFSLSFRPYLKSVFCDTPHRQHPLSLEPSSISPCRIFRRSTSMALNCIPTKSNS